MTTDRATVHATPAPVPACPDGAGSSLVPLAVRPGTLTSVVVHPAGGGLGSYLGIAGSLARHGPVYGLRARGLAPGEQPDRTVPAMVERYRPLLDALPNRPGLLLGWSLGGVLAWELAGLLRGPVPAVVLVDSRAAAPTGRRVARADLHAAVLAELAAEPDPDVRERALRTADAHLAAAAGHVVSTRHDGRALLITCAGEVRGDEHWPGADLHRARIPGRHFDAFTGPNVGRIQRHVAEFLRGTNG